MEESRRAAMEKRAARMALVQSSSISTVPSSSHLNPSAPPFLPKSIPVSSFKGNQHHLPSNSKQNGNARSSKFDAQGSKNKKDVPSDSWNVMTAPLTGTLSLISRDRFICYIGFNQKLNELFKSIPGSIFDANKKKWTFPLDQYENLKKKIEPLAPNITVGNLPKSVLKMFSNKNKVLDDFKSIDISRIEPTLFECLFPFQKEGVQFAVSKQGKCLIADEMGLGKTLQALAIADYYQEDWPILVICPSSMRFQWQEEILRYLKKIPSYGIIVVTNSKTVLEDPTVVIISYDLVSKLKDVLKNLKFGVIICDESHSLKSGKTVRTKAVLEVAKKARRVILLSGTPALSRPIELYYQFKSIAPNLFPDKVDYGVRYCDGKHDKFGWNDNGSSNLDELKVILEDNVMIRRFKTDVLHQLPSKIRQVVYLNPETLPSKKQLVSYEKQLQKEQIDGTEKRKTLLSYYHETGKAKVKGICDYVEQLLEQGKKFLIFAHHRDVLDGICEMLEEKKTYYIRIDGQVNSEDRKCVADQFQELDKFRVAVLSITAAGVGLTLTSAQLVVFAELFWNPGHLLQAEDRAHRIGQKSCVLIQYLIANGTADGHLWPLVQKKLEVLNQAGLSRDNKLNVIDGISSQTSESSQKKITEFFGELDDEIDCEALSELMDQIDAMEDFDGVPEKKMKRS
ncbi:hypothetical protein GE061_010834 [Apolygus lucorum]|uniref:SWI/SNF-related matrix-associated actin-dependent regulator of chromatin subfamily A-like protein 1 n=1 Tax=Apolygus lucorum TaxID=248454 RepID=A0A8S9XX65_APOLU|nr:hypothetical protein GE061_010834 [Apolygus lucorum]